VRGNALTVAFPNPGEVRDRAAALERRAKEATSAGNHKVMLYAAAGCRERADEDEDEDEAKQQRSDLVGR
jgi:hypothetical protein